MPHEARSDPPHPKDSTALGSAALDSTSSVSTAQGVYRRLRLIVTAPTTAFRDIRDEPGVRAGVSTLAAVGLLAGALMMLWVTSADLTAESRQHSYYWMARAQGLSHAEAVNVEAPTFEAPFSTGDSLAGRLLAVVFGSLFAAAFTPTVLGIAGAVVSVAWTVLGREMTARAGIAVMVWPAIILLPVETIVGVLAGTLGVGHYLTLAGPLPLETHPPLYLFAENLALTDLWYVALVTIGFSTVANGLSRKTAALVTTTVWFILSIPVMATMMWLYRDMGAG